MKSYIIEIIDRNTLQKDYIVFTEKDIFTMGHSSVNNHAQYVVDHINKKCEQKAFNISSKNQKLYTIALEILNNEGGCNSLTGHFFSGTSPQKMPRPIIKQPSHKRIINKEPSCIKPTEKQSSSSTQSSSLTVVHYNDAFAELEKLKKKISHDGKIPVLWSKSKGFQVEHLSSHYPMFGDAQKANMTDPAKVLDFITCKPQQKVCYIFEDFHHYMGSRDQVSPTVGDIRSLIKELHRSLQTRDETIYFLVPAFYELPHELVQLFNNFESQRHFRYLNRFAQLMTEQSLLQKTKPIIGVDNLIQRIVQILCQMETNNPLLVGQPGVGKTAIVEGFAKVLASGNVLPRLSGKKLYSLSLNSLIAGTKYRGDFESRLEGLMNEVLQNKDQIIVFIDEIHTLLDAGQTEGSSGASDILKPVLARGDFPCIGATTPEGEMVFSKDPAFSRRFRPIFVAEPSVEQTYEIMRGISSTFEHHHGLTFSESSLLASVELSVKYLPEENLPGKAISLLDGTAAYCSIKGKDIVTHEDILLEIERFKTTKRN
ncbi:MAG: ATP-dependent Clp protease ATP-binding subunit [Candidatus Magnetomorum sp.]|nr:ATP-dependent Clp protease ATP-binding subunit [Candidatus Magnetomorum sp.]